MPIDCMYRDAGSVEASWMLDLSTAAGLPIDVPRPPPPPGGHPLKSVTNLTVLGSAEPRIQQNANLRFARSL